MGVLKLEDFIECEVLGEVDYKANEETIFHPNIVFTCNEPGAYLTKAPQIIVEIISKSTAKRDEVYKFDIYEKEKVKYYIIVYPDSKTYDKQGDFTSEIYDFEETTCKASLDFKQLFKRFR